MYPNQPPSQDNTPYQPPQQGQQPAQPAVQQSSIDYLNQIAPPAKAAGFDKKTKIIIFIVGFLGLITLIFIVYSALTGAGSGNATPVQFAARLEKLKSLSETNDDRLKSNEIKNLNSGLSAVVASAKTAMAGSAESLGVKVGDLEDGYKAIDPDEELVARLDDAFLNNQLDATYAREIAFELQSTIIMMEQLNKDQTVKSFNELLTKYLKDFKSLQKRFADYKDIPTVINNPAVMPSLRGSLTPGYNSVAPSL